MKILLVNDDGIEARGIRELMRGLCEKHTVWVIAPDRQRSAVSKSMTLSAPLRAVPREIPGTELAYAVDGMPVDCARLGLGNLVPEMPDLVISGINHGPNLGSDTLYSGTCAAAQEAALLGVPALAMSLDHREPTHFETAFCVTERMIDVCMRHPLPLGMFWNVNVPDVPIPEIKGYQVTGLGLVRYKKEYERREDPLGRPYFWAPRGRIKCDPNDDTDEGWLSRGYVTVTPMGYHSEQLDAVDLSGAFGGEA
jgi:5''/3''-nucleotidase SurE